MDLCICVYLKEQKIKKEIYFKVVYENWLEMIVANEIKCIKMEVVSVYF